MNRPAFLILPFHGIGHFNALFGVARALEKTHAVVFAGTGHFYKHVTSRGFSYRSLASLPFGIGLETWIHEVRKSKYPLLKNIADRWSDRLYRERKAELTQLLGELKPVHVLIDAQQATDVVVVRAIDPSLKISIVSVAPPYLLIPGLPPINSLAMPGDDDSALRRSLRLIRSRAWSQKLRYLGLDDRTQVTRRLRRNNMMELKDVYPSLISLAVKGVDQYVLTYKEFDFHHKHLDSFRYVGSHYDAEYKEPGAEEHLRIIAGIKASGKKLVYCSFGTVQSDRDIQGFLVKFRKAMNDLDCAFIIADNRNWVPQSIVLSHADAFITHGGINSIHDAIRYKVPMIVYPIDMNYDQNGNSSRVVYHKLGLRGDLDGDTSEDIRKKLLEVFNFRKNFDSLDTSRYTIDNFIKMLLS